MKKKILLIITFIIVVYAACVVVKEKYGYEFSRSVSNVKFAGTRSSHYGIKPFPTAESWQQALIAINNEFNHSTDGVTLGY